MVERFLRDVRVYQRGRVDLKLTVTDRGRGKSEQREAEEDKQKETEVVGDDRVEGLLRNSISFLFRYLRVQSNYPLTFRDIIEPRRLEFPFVGTNVARGELTLNSKSLGIVPLSLSLSLSLFLSLSLSGQWTLIAFVLAALRSFLDSFARLNLPRQVYNHLGKHVTRACHWQLRFRKPDSRRVSLFVSRCRLDSFNRIDSWTRVCVYFVVWLFRGIAWWYRGT